MFLQYGLLGKCCICMENVVQDFLATGKFEDDYWIFEIVHAC